jgi:aerobic carbon-monoxide dehydrogenase small subunit
MSAPHDVTVELRVNGEPRRATMDARTTLADAIRDHFDLPGTHVGCGEGACGACTVLLDGEDVRGCLVLAAQADGREVTTVEGLGGADPVQRAFVDAHAFQCGWCTPGFVLTVKALLADTPHPSEHEIVEALGGNLCRCGSYVKIVEAARRAAAEPA